MGGTKIMYHKLPVNYSKEQGSPRPNVEARLMLVNLSHRGLQ
jgi:hypothetical protein